MLWQVLSLLACKPPVSALDQPDWRPSSPAVDDAIYFVLVDRFADGRDDNNDGVSLTDPQGWHGGDIQGVLDNLDHIQSLGFSTVWLSPVFDSRDEKFAEWGAYHGYWVNSLDAIDPRFGTAEDLKALADDLHNRGMRLVIDIVYNHTAFDAPMLTDHPDWYHEAKPIVNWSDPIEAQTHQVHGLPDLDQSNPDVRAYLLQQTTRWIREAHVDELRIDAVRHIQPDFFTALHQTLTNDFTQPVSTIGEIFNGDRRSLVAAWQQGAFTSVFDFPLYYAMVDSGCKGQPIGRIAATLAYERWTDTPGEWVTFLDNHDLPRIGSACDAERVPLLLATQMTSRGRPMMTYGTESGLEGMEEPDNRRDMDFNTLPHAETIRELLRLRATSPALTQGDTRIVALDEYSYLALRTTPSSSALVGVNLGPTSSALSIPSWLPTDQWQAIYGAIPLQESQVNLPANSVVVLERQGAISSRPTQQTQAVQFQASRQNDNTVLRLVGEGNALGDWNPSKAPIIQPEGLTLDLPAYAVLEFKLVQETPDGEFNWAQGNNQYLLVEPSENPLHHEVHFPAPHTTE